MKRISTIPLLAASLILPNGCMDSEDELKRELLPKSSTDDGAQVSAGQADFSKYVAVGNSLTAGFMDGALYTAGQQYSYPNLLAAQMRSAGGGEFNQPDIKSANGYNVNASNPANNRILGRLVLDTEARIPVPIGPGDITSMTTRYEGSNNNFGVPGARVVDLLSKLYGTPDLDFPEGNPYYARFASSPGNSTVLEDAAAARASFVTIWIGSNDGLGWLMSGGTAQDVAAAADKQQAIAQRSALTDEPSFKNDLAAIVRGLTAAGAKGGAIANLPDATFTPFFRAVSPNSIALKQTEAEQLMKELFGGYNAALDALEASPAPTPADISKRKVNYSAGANPILIHDDALSDISAQLAGINPLLGIFGQARPIADDELVLLTAGTVLGTDITPAGFPSALKQGVSHPIPDELILTADELAKYKERLALFNKAIAEQAAKGNLALVDIHALFLGIAAGGGTTIDGITLLPDFTPNGVFSVDGIHPNPRGSAIIANAFIDAINAKYKSTLQHVDVLSLPGISVK